MKKIFFLFMATITANILFLLTKLSMSSILIKHFRSSQSNQKSTPTSLNDSVHNITNTIIWACYSSTTNLPWLNTCLIRSLTAITLLRVFKIKSTLHIGARLEKKQSEVPKKLEAHMWIEDLNGIIICDQVADIDSYNELQTGEDYY
jgi:hypothetical protein